MASSSTVVLAGAGHAHLYVAAHAHALRARGARVLLVDPGDFWYSGLATGMLGGLYEAADDRIDPEALIGAGGGEFLRQRVEAVDPAARELRLESGATLRYDYLSLNVGSCVDTEAIPDLAAADGVWTVKPIADLRRLRAHLEARFDAGERLRIAVVGGGPTGAEIAANLEALGRRRRADLRVSLLTRGRRLMAGAPPGASRWLRRRLARRGIDVYTGVSVTGYEDGAVICGDDRRLAADLVVLATGLAAAPLVYRTGLPARPKAGLQVDARLRSIADPRVFAAGDCAAVAGFDLPKLGVFGVRQAAVIHANLLAALECRPLSVYRPQKRYLAIFNLGDGTALSTWGPLWWNGRSSLWLKDWIDRRFLRRFRNVYSEQR